MRLLHTVAALATASLVASSSVEAPLRVIRTTPVGDADPLATISVTFDRPVAGSLDRTVDPRTVMRVEPTIPGRLEWRDPVTVRLVPSAPLRPDVRYAVIVDTTFVAMDGSRLEQPARFDFRVRGPTLLGGLPVSTGQPAEQLTPDQRFDVVYSTPVDAARLSAAAHIEASAVCQGPRITRLRVVGQRPVTTDDDWRLREAGGWERNRAADTLRRVVQLAPATPLAHGCDATLVLPNELAADLPKGLARWHFRTYGDFRLTAVRCGSGAFCPTGPVEAVFSTPVRGAVVQRSVTLLPGIPFIVRDTAATSTSWTLEAPLDPNKAYVVVVDTSARDTFGQRLEGNPAILVRSTGYEPSISYPFGRQLVERKGFRTLAVQHVNVDTMVASIAPIPDSLEARFLARYAWSVGELWADVAPLAERRRIATASTPDRPAVTGVVLPVNDASRGGAPTLYAVKIEPARRAPPDVTGRGESGESPVSVVQVTDLGVTARIGTEEGMVWVTGVSDGLPRGGATVTLHAPSGEVIASGRTNAQGLVRLAGFRTPTATTNEDRGFEGYVAAVLRDDRALVPVNQYDPDLSPWNFGVRAAWGDDRYALAGAVFTERGIYRPGERVYAKAIVRTGSLGALSTPATGDSARWVFTDRDGQPISERTVALSAFGTNDQTLDIPTSAPIGQQQVRLLMRRAGEWRQVAWTTYRVAEYRPPEFLVEMAAAAEPAHPGDRFAVTVRANYLFGAPMGRAELRWSARQAPLSLWDLEIPGTDGWHLGESGWGWDDDGSDAGVAVFGNGIDTLDARGERTVTVTVPTSRATRAARVTIEASVTDVNRQSVGTTSSTVVHPAAFYIAARPQGESWFWKEGEPQRIAVRAVRPNGDAEGGVRVRGMLVRREWHQVRRVRGGLSQLVGEWVSDTVARCAVTTTTGATPPTCTLTPRAGGMHMIVLEATDARGRRSATTFGRWISGSGYVPWSDETQFKMDVIADRDRYAVGDTATVMLASPFTNAEAWITVEREGILEQRRMRLTSGATTIKLPITEAYVPNAFVSVVVTRGRSEPPGKLDDPGRPTIRVGYAELRVTPEVKRLAVDVAPLSAEYRPGDTARVRLAVRDARNAGARSEVALWAVDEGVLALTGYTTPDPIDLLYRTRGLGMRLASNLVVVAPQIPDGDKGARRSAGGGGGAEAADVLRSRFKTTAFFLGSVVTDAQGNATVSAALPENLTTFRLMAVAVTAGDRYGSGESKLLVTRPLVARPALPRFVRPGDELLAGTVINRRDGSAAPVRVSTVVEGLRLMGDAQRNATLAAGRGAEVRFRFRAEPGDSVSFRFDVRGGNDVDAVRVRVPVRPDYSPRFHTVAGIVRDTGTAEFRLPADIDPARSRLSLSLGSSPLAIVRGIRQDLRVYPYYCTEQVISTAAPILALLRAERAEPGAAASLDRGRGEIEQAIAIIARRQRVDGGIGYWGADDWTTPWLSAYAGHLLLDARDIGVTVDQGMIDRLAEYLRATLRGELPVNATRVAAWYTTREARLADQVASVEFLSRIGKPDVGAENELVRMAAQISREDRIRLAETLHRRGARAPARQLIESVWADVTVEGRRAVLSPVRQNFYFPSQVREEARLLMATLAIEPTHALIGPLVETLVAQGRATAGWIWNTQDHAFAVNALAAFERHQREAGTRTVRVRSGNRVLWTMRPGEARGIDTAVALEGLLGRATNGERTVRLALDAQGSGEAAAYYYLTVSEVPLQPPVRPDDAGIRVERWYENFETSQPVTSVTEGELVRVRLRVTVPAERHFVVLDDPLPAGLEAIDLSLRTAPALPTMAAGSPRADAGERDAGDGAGEWGYGRWDSGWWSPWEHREIRDDRVVYSAAMLWPGSYTATYVARATTPGVFVRPPAHAEEMYNPAVQGRSDGGTFTVRERPPR